MTEATETVFSLLSAAAAVVDPKFAAPHEKETSQQFYKRVVRAITELPEADWDKLPEPAQIWFNEAARAVTDEKTIADMPGYSNGSGAAASAEPAKKKSGKEALAEFNAKRKAEKEARLAAEASAEKKPAEKPAKKSAKTEKPADETTKPAEAAKPKEKAPKEKKEKAPKAPGSVERLRAYVIDKPDISREALAAIALKEGMLVKDATISAVISDTNGTLKVLKALGYKIVKA